MFCRFGGAGAKARKGFGSFAGLPGFDLDALKKDAADFRARCGLGAATFQSDLACSPALGQMLGPLEVPTGGADCWLAIDQLAAAAQNFAKKYKHQAKKKALGLPRDPQAPRDPWTPGPHARDKWVNGRMKKARHASPVLYHFDRVGGRLVARVVAFPAAELPNVADSTKLLQELLTDLGGGLAARFAEHVKGDSSPPPPPPPAIGSRLTKGQKVVAKIVQVGQSVRAEAGGLKGPVYDVPPSAGLKVGDERELIVATLNEGGKPITFKFPK